MLLSRLPILPPDPGKDVLEILPPDPGEDVLDVVQKSGWEAASEPQARRSRTEQHNMAATAGLSATLLYRELRILNTTLTERGKHTM